MVQPFIFSLKVSENILYIGTYLVRGKFLILKMTEGWLVCFHTLVGKLFFIELCVFIKFNCLYRSFRFEITDLFETGVGTNATYKIRATRNIFLLIMGKFQLSTHFKSEDLMLNPFASQFRQPNKFWYW